MLGLAPATGIMVEPLFNNFATVAFFEFIVFAIFEMRFLLTVWRARRSNNADIWQVAVHPHNPVCRLPASHTALSASCPGANFGAR